MEENGLVNNFTHAVDSKNRVNFPAKFREDLGVPFIVTVSVDDCLCAYSMADWQKFLEKLKSMPKMDTDEITRFFCGYAIKAVPDSQGRVMLTKDLLEMGDIEDSIVFLGCGDRVELWNPKNDPLKKFDKNFRANLKDKMKELRI